MALLTDLLGQQFSGAQGTQGIQGTLGVQGLSNQGVQGSIGIQGRIGSQGSQGVQGLSNQGVQGSIGIQGNVGSQGSQGVQGSQGILGNQGNAAPKAISIASPTSTEKITLFFTTASITISQIRSIVSGTTPSVTFSIRYGADYSGAGTEVVTSGITVTNTTTGLNTNSFNNATVPANNFVWLTTSATSGTVTLLNVSLIF